MSSPPVPRSVRQRWSTASELLRLVHDDPGVTRTDACDRLSLSSGTATELIERLRNARLLAETRADPVGRGRPTSMLGAHPEGPLVVVVDLRSSGWTVLLGDLVGQVTGVASGSYEQQEPAEFLPRIATAVARGVRIGAGRVRTVVAVVAGTVSGTRVLQFATRGWNEADLGVLVSKVPRRAGVPLLAGNDATLGGLAEARTGAARGAAVAVHLHVAVGVGGVLLVDGKPTSGTRGAGGEYGHLPFGDPTVRCPCGAWGCWDMMVDGRALARHRGDTEPADPIAYARQLLDDLLAGGVGDDRSRHAVELAAQSLGAGIAGLVNLHDPELVTLGGLGPMLRTAAPKAFDDALQRGLMSFHRQDPPPIRESAFSQDGPVRGAITLGVDEITSPAGLALWEGMSAAG